MDIKSKTSGILYVVPTPIGNLSDLSEHIINTLSIVDIIAAEDTRRAMYLLNHLGIHKKLVSYHKFNELTKADYLIHKLLSGKSVAIVTDAGTPCISDPGYILVRNATKNHIQVIGLCGPCAAITALSVSGFNTNSFAFWGFLPRKKCEIQSTLKNAVAANTNVGVFYESPKRILETINIICSKYPEIELCLCNDLTKKYEMIYRGTAIDVLAQLTNNSYSEKGEYTLVLNFASLNKSDGVVANFKNHHLESVLLDYLIDNDCSIKDAVNQLSKMQPYRRNELYKASLRMKLLLEKK